jgi:hypothetical protein
MCTIELPDEAHRRVEAFADVYRAVMDEDVDVSKCLAVIVERGFQAALSDILRNQDQAVLIESISTAGFKTPGGGVSVHGRHDRARRGHAQAIKARSRINTWVRTTLPNIAMEPTAHGHRSAPRLIANVRRPEYDLGNCTTEHFQCVVNG